MWLLATETEAMNWQTERNQEHLTTICMTIHSVLKLKWIFFSSRSSGLHYILHYQLMALQCCQLGAEHPKTSTATMTTDGKQLFGNFSVAWLIKDFLSYLILSNLKASHSRHKPCLCYLSCPSHVPSLSGTPHILSIKDFLVPCRPHECVWSDELWARQ